MKWLIGLTAHLAPCREFAYSMPGLGAMPLLLAWDTFGLSQWLAAGQVSLLFAQLAYFILALNVLSFCVYRQRVFIKYALYILVCITYFSVDTLKLLHIHRPQLSAQLAPHIPVWYSLIFISYFWFINELGGYKYSAPWVYRLLNAGILYKLVQSGINSLALLGGVRLLDYAIYRHAFMVAEIGLMLAIIFFAVQQWDKRGSVVIIASILISIGGVLDQTLGKQNGILYLLIMADMLIFMASIHYFYNRTETVPERHLAGKVSGERETGSLLITKGNTYRKLCPTEVLYLKAEGSYTLLYTTSREEVLYSHNLKSTLALLNSPQLVRVHRSYAVNKKYVDKLNSSKVYVADRIIPASKSYPSLDGMLE